MEMKVIKSSCDIVGLRDVLDTIESHVRALDCQGVNKEHFGAVLIPILEEKIPKDVRLEKQKHGEGELATEEIFGVAEDRC